MAVPKIESSWLDIESQRRRGESAVAQASIDSTEEVQKKHAEIQRQMRREEWYFKSTISRHPGAPPEKDSRSEETF